MGVTKGTSQKKIGTGATTREKILDVNFFNLVKFWNYEK